ncbi:MAG: 23S rRNA (adenine(2503)-C(2))-methyltransferase RlmN [Nannocystaceae bacterium]
MDQLAVIRPPAQAIPRPSTPNLRGLDIDELRTWVATAVGGPSYRTQQLWAWIHHRRVLEFAAMTNLGRVDRKRLEQRGSLSTLNVAQVERAQDDTRKLRLRTHDGHAIESVLIPNDERGYTLCISSQVGCALTCSFCATATLPFARHLAAWEIVDQVYRAVALLEETTADPSPKRQITNLVYMGMGEPLLNFQEVQRSIAILTHPDGLGIAGRRITVSTAGVLPAIERFGREGLGERVGLAVSLNASTDAVRDEIMPINRQWPMAELLACVGALPENRRRDLTFEYVLLAEVNDTPADAQRLGRQLRSLRCHVNIIPFNPHPASRYRRPPARRISAFVTQLRAAGVSAYLRTPRGDDIGAACGQLALQEPTLLASNAPQ